MTDVLNGKYTDFRPFVSWCFGSDCPKGSMGSRSGSSKITAQQLEMIAKLGTEARRARTVSLGQYMKSIPHSQESRSGTDNRLGTAYFWNRMKKSFFIPLVSGEYLRESLVIFGASGWGLVNFFCVRADSLSLSRPISIRHSSSLVAALPQCVLSTGNYLIFVQGRRFFSLFTLESRQYR
jgi:hypothetical protein